MLDNEKKLRTYLTSSGSEPFAEWFNKLKDKNTQQVVYARLARLRLGNFGDSKTVGEGVSELRIDYGHGYRIYFGRDGLEIVILLLAGDKGSQKKDIRLAQGFWKAYKKEKRSNAY